MGGISAGAAKAALGVFETHVNTQRINLIALDVTVRSRFEMIIEQCNCRKPPIALRTLDAIHVASAISSSVTEIVATDKRLRDAALFFGLTVFPI